MLLGGGRRKASSGDHVENDENENMPSGAAASHVNADTHNGDPKKKRKRKHKKKKSDQAGGSLQDTVEEDGHLAKKMKTESTMKEKEKQEEVPGTETFLTKELRPSRAQRRRLRKRIIKKLYMEKTKSQNNASNVREEQETQGEDNAKERKLNGADDSLASVNNGKENTDMKTEDVATKKKRKRRRKKKQNPVSDSADVVIKEDKNKEVKEENVQPKKMKKETTEDTPDKKETEPETAKKKKVKGNFKKMVLDKVNPSLANAKNKRMIADCWKNGSEGVLINNGNIEVIKSPFTCGYIHNLLKDETCLDGVKKELDTVELYTKNNDLYKFRQTGDLKGVTTPFISALRYFLRTFVRQWLSDVTGLPLNDEIDMSSSRYSHTDVLLCHDDELEGRRIAYILYLLPPWGPEDGGSLDLFATDGDGHPSHIVRSITPENNAFAFFEVSPVSFHQVSEVLSCDKTRLSINGWFHGPPVPRPKRDPPPPSPLTHPVHLQETDFYAWINPMFLDANIQKEIRQTFCSESEINLENFLTDEAYKRLSEALNSEGLAWQLTGPADRQRYEILSPDSMPQDVKECRQFLGCEALFLVLSQLTGLKLHRLAPQDSDDEEECSAEPNPQCHVEAQRWGPGCYTLIRDDCVDSRAALDTFLYANVSQQWTQELGGHVTYIAKDEDEELLTVGPQSNCLCLVYRDTQTLKFTKYINSAARDLKANDSHFTNFACTYYE